MREQVMQLVRDARAGNLRPEEIVRAVRREFIVQTLRAHNFNQCAAARALDVHRNTLMRQIQELNIAVDELRDQRKPAVSVAAGISQRTHGGTVA